MDPNSRNRVLVIGGALIVIALLLVCGPLQDRLGSDRSGTALSPVAAGPPETPGPPTAASTPGLLETASQREPALLPIAPGQAGEDRADAEVAAAASAPVQRDASADVGAALETAAAAANVEEAGEGALSTPVGAAIGLPAVSAGPPPSPTPADVYDDVLAANSLGWPLDELGVGPAGPVSRRFAPPVASGGPMPLGIEAAKQFGIDSSVLRPCDTPGSGCQNLVSAAGRPNPPIRPGVRPVPPPPPPMQPGAPATP